MQAGTKTRAACDVQDVHINDTLKFGWGSAAAPCLATAASCRIREAMVTEQVLHECCADSGKVVPWNAALPP